MNYDAPSRDGPHTCPESRADQENRPWRRVPRRGERWCGPSASWLWLVGFAGCSVEVAFAVVAAKVAHVVVLGFGLDPDGGDDEAERSGERDGGLCDASPGGVGDGVVDEVASEAEFVESVFDDFVDGAVAVG